MQLELYMFPKLIVFKNACEHRTCRSSTCEWPAGNLLNRRDGQVANANLINLPNTSQAASSGFPKGVHY